MPERDIACALSGRYSLRLPGLQEGGYRLSLHLCRLTTWRLQAGVQSGIWRHGERGDRGAPGAREDFAGKHPSGQAGRGGDFLHVQGRVRSREDVLFDDVSLVGEGGMYKGNEPYVRLHPDSPQNVYDIAHSASMNLFARGFRLLRIKS